MRTRFAWRAWERAAAACALVLVLAAGASCTRRAVVARDPARADALFERLKADQAAGKHDEAALAARELVQHHSDFPLIDEATFRAGEVALAQGLAADAAKHFEAVVVRYPLSPLRERALVGAARAYSQLEMYEKSADALLRLLSSPVDAALREEATDELRELVGGRLDRAELENLVKEFPASVLSGEIALHVARKEYARGNYDAAHELLTNYLYEFPEGADAVEARRLLGAAADRRRTPAVAPSTPADPNTVGVVLPVTGPGAAYGRYFAQGVDAALEEYNASTRRPVKLAKADSKGSPVGAVKAVRRLLSVDGAVGVVGSVFTTPTMAAAIESNAWGAALLSPVVSSDDLVEIGPWVFQTKVPLEVEVTAVAEAAVTKLSIRRFAVVAPSDGSRRGLGELFRDEVARLGAEVVAMEYYEAGETNFRTALEAVRKAAPEAIFAPGSVEELLLLIPQVKFYDLQVQLLGLSHWNSDKLLRLSRDDLEGALFPLEAYRGEDPNAYVRFKERMAAKGVREVSPVTEAGYFGMRLMLKAISSGASSRDEVRAYLDAQLRQGAQGRMAEARALSLVRVRGGRIESFGAPAQR